MSEAKWSGNYLEGRRASIDTVVFYYWKCTIKCIAAFYRLYPMKDWKTKGKQLLSAFRTVRKFTTFGVKKQCEILTVTSMQLTITAVQSKSFVTCTLSYKCSSLSRMFYCTFYNVFIFRNYCIF